MSDNKSLLDELMGKDRNLDPSMRNNRTVHFTDPEVCKSYICGFCPSELFVNTKSDVGVCNKVHPESCKAEYQKVKKSYPEIERNFIRYLESIVDDLDRRMKKGRERTDLEDINKETLPNSTIEKPNAVSERIQALLKQIEDLGEEGRVEECQTLIKVVDSLKSDQTTTAFLPPGAPQEKKMRVCEVCGALLVVGDTDKRASSHLEGKQHIGFALIRKTIEDYKKFNQDDRRPYRDDRPREYYDRDRSREGSRGSGSSRSYDRGYDRGGYDRSRDSYNDRRFDDRDRRNDYRRDDRRREREDYSDRDKKRQRDDNQ